MSAIPSEGLAHMFTNLLALKVTKGGLNVLLKCNLDQTVFTRGAPQLNLDQVAPKVEEVVYQLLLEIAEKFPEELGKRLQNYPPETPQIVLDKGTLKKQSQYPSTHVKRPAQPPLTVFGALVMEPLVDPTPLETPPIATPVIPIPVPIIPTPAIPPLTPKRRSKKTPRTGPPPVTVEDFHNEVLGYIDDNNLGAFFDSNDQSVKNLAKRTAAQAEVVTTKFGLDSDDKPGLIKLALYDFRICFRAAAKPQADDSWSMRRERRKEALLDILRRVADIAIILKDTGISLRFLNKDQKLDNLTSVTDIEREVKAVGFLGWWTTLGGALDSKIVQPMVIEKAESKTLRRPVIAIMITDGKPEGEPPESLRDTIISCKKSEKLRAFGEAAVVFLISRVGGDAGAEKFLTKLEADRELEGMVYCSTDSLDKVQDIFQKCENDDLYTGYLLKLFLAALECQTK
ncbi:MAG: hypothetical protein M1840_007782 [Geoglossum simile]|nr:MAG: hypothetical protein M1840_007782 [Geoglossum simile]